MVALDVVWILGVLDFVLHVLACLDLSGERTYSVYFTVRAGYCAQRRKRISSSTSWLCLWARGWVHGTQRGVGQLRVSRVRAVLYILSYLIFIYKLLVHKEYSQSYS